MSLQEQIACRDGRVYETRVGEVATIGEQPEQESGCSNAEEEGPLLALDPQTCLC
jgi:hypothetical protein